jgi:hypothetical protein|uniref:Uncharacterized protein n=1 Tax=viral metagenome TaxID=1070528 RepID=A0A6C0LJF8_9ZZZZ
MEFDDLRVFIKRNSKIMYSKINYTDEGNIYNYKINANGNIYEFKLINDGETIKMDYNDTIIDNDNDIQLEIFEMLNYKNIEYIDCYIIRKRNETKFEILDMYDDYYDNVEKKLICNRSFKKNDKQIKIKIICQNDEYVMYYNMEEIYGFEEIIQKLDLIL